MREEDGMGKKIDAAAIGKRIVILASLAVILLLAGCASKEKDGILPERTQEGQVQPETLEMEIESSHSDSEADANADADIDANAGTGTNANTGTDTGKPEQIQQTQGIKTAETLQAAFADFSQEPILMTLEEMMSFEQFLNEEDGYGFLLSEYDSPEYMDINQVFYQGAGAETFPLSEEEKEAFLAATGEREIYTDITRLTRAQIDDILAKHAGIGLKDIKTRFDWVYIPQFDSYYHEHGDTNKAMFTCMGGSRQGDTYRIDCKNKDVDIPLYSCRVTVKRTQEGWQFQANEIVEDGLGIRENQAKEEALSSIRHALEGYRKKKGYLKSDYKNSIFNSNMRYYTRKELLALDPKLYAVFRNEIYARHGYIFKNEDWNKFFGAYEWYEGIYPGDEFDVAVFNQFEDANLKLIKELER